MKTTRHPTAPRAIAVMLVFAAAAAITPVAAQDSEPVPAAGTAAPGQSPSPGISELSVDGVEARLAAIEQDDALLDAAKHALLTKYREALQFLGNADTSRARTAELRASADVAPREAEQFARQLEDLPPAEEAAKVHPSTDADQLSRERDLRRTSLQELERQIEGVETELSHITGRPAEIVVRLPKAKDELEATEDALDLIGDSETVSPGRAAERLRLRAMQEALTAEIEMLREEQSSQIARENHLTSQRDLLLGRRDNEGAALAALDDLLQQQRLTEAERLRRQVARLAGEMPDATGDAAQLIAELEGLVLELVDVAEMMEELDLEYSKLSTRLDRANGKFRRLQEQVKLGGLAGTFGQTLIAQYRILGNPRELELSIQDRQQTLREVRLANFNVEEVIAEQLFWEGQVGAAGLEADQRLLSIRADVLTKLQHSYRDVIDDLLLIDSQARTLRDLILEFRKYLNNKLFWIRSSPAVTVEVVTSLPGSLAWFFSARHGRALANSLTSIPRYHPFLASIVGLFLVALLATRRRIASLLAQRGKQVRRVSSDRYAHTVAVLGGTLLLIAPVPVTLAFFGWSFVQDPAGAGWLQGLGLGLLWAAGFLGFVSFLRCCTQSDGLGPRHFGWGQTATKRLRSTLLTLFLPYVALLVVTSSALFASDPRHIGSLGRFCFVLAQLWLAAGLWKLLRPSDGLFTTILSARPRGVLSWSRFLWFALAVGIPLVTAGLAIAGYVLTAFALNAVFLGSLGHIAAGVVLYYLVLRWFMIKERKMAVTEVLEARRARREDASSSESEPDPEMSIAADEVEMELDLDDVSAQTRRLLRSLTSIVVVLFLWWYWERALPVDEFLGKHAIGHLVSLLGVAQAILVIAVAVTVVRNLPGLLDLAGFRDSGIDAGTRHAVATICQYALGAIALGLLAHILGLDWSQFGWIAAALSVGLGFGLQEVVANFVCGIILLFERPIRLGDIVTLDGVTGAVSRIRMRATTITNWDRQDYVVPNKQFITGSIVNWTLLNPINRIIIPVGVAYGSDTGRAMQLLREVAEQHPVVMEDPAPLISFESFGDSTLDLTLRAYLPNMDNRLKIITELNGEIDRRFREAGIEIAFPQRDLHLRSIGPGIQLGGAGSGHTPG